MSAAASGPYAIPPALAYALLHALWQGALLALLAAASFAVLRRRGAAARHTAGLVCLLAIAAAAFATFAVYRHAPAVAAAPSGERLGPMLVRGADWLAVVVPLAWLLGAGALLVRQLAGWRLVGALDRRASGELPGEWQHRVDALRSALRISRAVAVRPADDAASPFTARALRPVLWLPVSRLTALSPEQRDAILLHELAHVRRLDWLWNGLQCTLEALLFFHPAVWWLGRRIREEREHACDELAAATCGDPVALAEALAALERRRVAPPGLVLAAHGGSLVQRITYLLSGSVARLGRRIPIGLAALLSAGYLLATRLELPSDLLLNLKVDASTAGPLRPGTFREITAEAFNARHHYRSTMTGDGSILERYEQDGEPRPIDPAVRAWIDDLVAVGARPAGASR